MIVRGAPTERTKPVVEHGVLGMVVYAAPDLPTHLVPTWDLRGHALDEHGEACACGPRWDEEQELFRHNAFDGRERYEYGQARKH